jgi:UPF0716 family protein affecting phage T7 exclusion
MLTFLLVVAAFAGGWYLGAKSGAATLAKVEAELASLKAKL